LKYSVVVTFNIVEKVNKLFPAARSIVLCNVKNKVPLSKETVAIHWLDIFEILGEFI
jgi:hypothetical protein